jgi:glycosyltransferase involved in cell wall biosynthesis
MRLSIVVIFHNMAREAMRTLYALSPAYQQNVDAQDYEVIAVDNGSEIPLCPNMVAGFGAGFRLIRHQTSSVSPVGAINLGVAQTTGDAVAIIVDGARMASPGLVAHSLQALRLAELAVVYARSWHLGPDIQNKTVPQGYNQATEDALLEQINWQTQGYRLFEISTLAQSSHGGFFGAVPAEFSWVALPRQLYEALGGYDARFQAPGGGLVNHHFRNRALSFPATTPVALLGEGVFHQVHGGVATNVPMHQHPMKHFRMEYQEITGAEYKIGPAGDPLYFGRLAVEAHRFIREMG